MLMWTPASNLSQYHKECAAQTAVAQPAVSFVILQSSRCARTRDASTVCVCDAKELSNGPIVDDKERYPAPCAPLARILGWVIAAPHVERARA
jgi:hypothetical protein